MPNDLPIFTPRPEIVPKVLDDLCDADLSLRDIAHKARTTVEALSLWLATDDIQERLNLIRSTIAQRTRLAATCFLPAAVRTVNRVLEAYEHEEDRVPGGVRPGSLMGHEYRRRSRESARRACSLLLRLARFSHEPVRRSSPAGCGGGGAPRSGAEGDAHPPRAPKRAPLTLHDLRELLTSQLQPVPQAVAVPGDCLCEPTGAPDTGRSPSRPAGSIHSDPVHLNGHAHSTNNEHWP